MAAVVLVLLSACGAPASLAEATADGDGRYTDIAHVDGSQAMAECTLLLDVRSAEEYAVSHLPGAVRWAGAEVPRWRYN